MSVKTEEFTKRELDVIYKDNDPVVMLLLTNGWRNNELVQAIRNYTIGSDKVLFRPKKRLVDELTYLTKYEIKLLGQIKTEYKIKNQRALNRHFERLGLKLGITKAVLNKKTLSKEIKSDIHPHRCRVTFATKATIELGTPIAIVSSAMHHKNLPQTIEYIKVSHSAKLELKENMEELKTLDGMTIYELREYAVSKIKQINRLERELQRERNKQIGPNVQSNH